MLHLSGAKRTPRNTVYNHSIMLSAPVPPALGAAANPFYYLDNFHQVLDWLEHRSHDLLAPDELAFIATFRTLPQSARALLVRMVMRKGSVFRASKLTYAEIGSPVEAARSLLAQGWLVEDPPLSLDALFELLSKPELAALFQLPASQRQSRKADQLSALRTAYPGERPLSKWHGNLREPAYQITIRPLCERLRLIFFGNLRQDWSEFILAHLGVFRYETVDFSNSARGFRERRDVDDYLHLHQCKEAFRTGGDLHAVLAALPATALANPWLNSRRERLMFDIAQQCERQEQWQLALDLYRAIHYPGARGRAIRVLEKCGRVADAYALYSAARQAPENEAERQQLDRIGPRLARRLGREGPGRPRRRPVPELLVDLPQPEAPWWVEGLARDHFHQDGAPVFYVENTLINSLFGLLCWPALFATLPGAFFHPFQREPADLHSADFYRRRADHFNACLGELDDGRHAATIRQRYRDKHGIESAFVAWDTVDEQVLELALSCIPPQHLRCCFERLLANLKDNRTGLPDLIQFWPDEGRYRMIEVKGPGDRLQDNQLRWLDYCMAHAIPVAVCYLRFVPLPAREGARPGAPQEKPA
jgi:hypothetical protein